jgi:hypothetical protein
MVVAALWAGALGCSSSSSSGPSTHDGGADGSRDAGKRRDSGRVDSGRVDSRADSRPLGQPDASPDVLDGGCALSSTCHACLATDPANCGTCGNSCGAGGSCSGGFCARVLATGQAASPNVVEDIVIDDDSVYWIPATGGASGGRVVSVPKAGGTITTLASGVALPEGLAQDSSYVYFVSHNVGVERVAKTGGPSTQLLQDGVSGVDPDDFPEFWLLVASPDLYYVGGQGTGVYEMPIGGGDPTPLTTSAGLLGAPGTGYYAVAVDDAGVYYDTVSQIVIVDRAANLQIGVVPGSSPTAGDRFGPTLAIDDASIYFISNVLSDAGIASSLMKVAKGADGGAPALITSDSVGFDDGPIVVDDTSVYWSHTTGASGLDGVVLSVPKGGGSVVTVATGCAAQCPFAVDATTIYWPTSDGKIRSDRKQPL